MSSKNIVAIGGGGFGRSLGSLEIEKYIVKNKKELGLAKLGLIQILKIQSLKEKDGFLVIRE